MIQQPHFWLYVMEGNGITTLKSYLCPYVHYDIMHSSQEPEPTKVPINKQTDTEHVIHAYTYI